MSEVAKKPGTSPVAILDSGQDWSIAIHAAQLPLAMGRHPDCAIVVSDPMASRRHCVLELHEGTLCLRDTDSANGTALGDRGLKRGERIAITRRTCIVMGELMLWVAPVDAEGKWDRGEGHTGETQIRESHGICIVDLCDSTEQDLRHVAEAMGKMKTAMRSGAHESLLLLKNTGDGYLAVYRSPMLALRAAEQLLEWQSGKDNPHRLDIRIALDAGPTFPIRDRDRLGLAINRAARLEKIQRGQFDSPGKRLGLMKARNRCLLSASLRQAIRAPERRRCLFLGRLKLKGFGGQLHPVYQYFFGPRRLPL
ncbi:MAG: FHA domain-containing protein [Planctomycetota bacterium]|nr:FHA domain-containing protein [Planctomycetota bacterium]